MKNAEDSLISIQDHLSGSDWTFAPIIKEGTRGDYHWIELNYDFPYEKLLSPSKPYRVLVTYYNWYGGPADEYEMKEGWQPLGNFALSDLIMDSPLIIDFDQDTALMYLDTPISDQRLDALRNFGSVEPPDLKNEDLWKMIESFSPYFFAAHMDNDFYISRDKSLLDSFHSAELLSSVEQQERSELLSARLAHWNNVGPECGPEKCAENGCARLRIERAVLCYIHQWKTFQPKLKS